MMFNDVCTIYNKYIDSEGVEKWQRTVLTGIFWDSIAGANFRKTGLEKSDKVQLMIPHSVTVSRSYAAKKAWQDMEDKSGYWTLKEGDTIVKGSLTHEVTKSSKELDQFDDCFKVTKIDNKAFGSPMDHWEVGGK